MQTTLGNLIAIKKTLDEISKKDLPIDLSWKIAKLLLKLIPLDGSFEEQKNKLIRKYGEEVKDSEGKGTGNIKVAPDKEPQFFEELSTLLETKEETDLPTFEKSEFKFKNKDGVEEEVSLKMQEILALSPILKME